MNLLFYAQFKASKVGVDVSATINIYSVNRSSGATASVVSGGATTHVTNGIRVYQLTNADLTTYDYVGAFVTTDATVDDKQPPCLWTKWSDVATDTSGNASVGTLANNTITANSIASDAITAAKIAADAIGASELAASAVTEIQSGLSTHSPADVWSVATRALTDKSNFGLSSDEREAVATAVESHLLNEGDSQMLINAIVGAIGNTNMDEVALVAAIRADLERNGGALASIFADYARRTSDYATATNVSDAADDVIAAMPQPAPTVEAIDAALSAAHGEGLWGADAGSGPYAVTVQTGVAGANVLVTKGVTSYAIPADNNGNAVFRLTSGVWSIAAAAAGYAGASTSVTVSSAANVSLPLQAVVIVPSGDPQLCLVYGYTRTALGQLSPQQTVQLELREPSSEWSGLYNYRDTVTSDSNGYLQVELPRGASYAARLGNGLQVKFTVPDEGSYQMPDIVSR